MTLKLLTLISLFASQISISQTGKVLTGKVVFQNNPLKNVEVINKTSKTSTTTNGAGEFSILVNAKDSLIFFSKDYFFKRLKVTQEMITRKNIEVKMALKPEELDEVVITDIKMDPIVLDPEVTAEIDIYKRGKNLTRFIDGYKDGSITNGMKTAITIGGGKSHKKDSNQSEFKKLVKRTCPKYFFTQTLKIKPEEKDLFLEFCDADPKSQNLLNNSNLLSTMEFLTIKNKEFKSLQ